ncbi:hypothetical protein NYO67_5116 [Aspergillus flavus]|nr:hypothetical protein NYO67_5116 [Aspergillus flavus]
MASPQPPSVLPLSPPDLDNECSEIRTEVLQRLKAICQEKLGRETFPPTFWAFCQVADIAKLEQMISQAESVDSETAQLILEPTIKDCDPIIDQYSAAVKCKERDNGEYILTRFPGPNVDIYPSCLLAASAREPRAVERGRGLVRIIGKYKDSEEPELEAIASGDVLTVTTSDPETMPLPGWALLEMQWYLRRVAGMSGATEEVEEDIPDYDNDDEDTSEFGSCLSVLVA